MRERVKERETETKTYRAKGRDMPVRILRESE